MTLNRDIMQTFRTVPRQGQLGGNAAVQALRPDHTEETLETQGWSWVTRTTLTGLMVTVTITQHLRREGFAGPWQESPGSLRDVLDRVFSREPRLRSYFLDDQGAVRHHVAVFIDGESVTDRQALSVPVPDGAEVHLLQALSGG